MFLKHFPIYSKISKFKMLKKKEKTLFTNRIKIAFFSKDPVSN